jgi:predicted metal-dependent RNase
MNNNLKGLQEQIEEVLPKECELSKIELEGPQVVLYLKNIRAFYQDENLITKLAGRVRKKILLRSDAAVLMAPEKALPAIKSFIPEGAGVAEIKFDPVFHEVVIEALKPGLVIGKGGSVLKSIILETGWAPRVLRAPTSPSEVEKAVRNSLIANAEDRKKFLNSLGKKMYSPPVVCEWVKITALGGFKEVGRSCVLLQTPKSNVLLDCGLNIDTSDSARAYPYLNAMNLALEQLDAVIISHAHLDHSGFLPYLYAYGYEGPTYCTPPTRDLMVLLQQDCVNVLHSDGKESPFGERDIKKSLNHVITREYGEVTDITPEIRFTFHNAGHVLGSAEVHLHIGEGMHNLVYSVDGKETIFLVDNKGTAQLREIGEFIDEQCSNHAHEKSFVEEVQNNEGWNCIAFNPKTLKSEVVEITSFLRHPINEELYEITTSTGRKVTVTKSHSLFTVKNGRVEEAKACDLKEGDNVVGLKRLDTACIDPVVELSPQDFSVVYDDCSAEKKLSALLEAIKKHFPKKAEVVVEWIREYLTTSSYAADIAKRFKVKAVTVNKALAKLGIPKKPRVGHALPQKFFITPSFARLLGYYVSEGSVNKNTLRITNFDKKLLEDVTEIVLKEFGLNCPIYGHDAAINSKQLVELVKLLGCGTRASEKRVPKPLLLASPEITREFLHGYFAGDGSLRIRKKGISINATSKSRMLLQELAFLLIRFGITSTFSYNKSTEMHDLHVYGREQITKLLEILDIGDWSVVKSVEKRKSSFSERIPLTALSEQASNEVSKSSWRNANSVGAWKLLSLKMLSSADRTLLSSDLLLDSIKRIKKVSASGKYVYDLSVRGYENFVGGQGHLFLHNTGDIKFGRTKLFDPADTRFPRIETILVESTYGGREDIKPNIEETEQKLIEAIKATVARCGKVLIPVLAVGRAQEIMLVLEEYLKDDSIPVYLDGMSLEANAIHTVYPEYLKKSIQRRILQNNSPFDKPMFISMAGKDRKSVAESNDPCVILAPSGMLSGGPSVEFLKLLAGDEKNALIFVGYQGAMTLGRKIQGGEREVPILSEKNKLEPLKINMTVLTMDAFSGHSDRAQLLAFMKNLRPRPGRVLTMHGDEQKCDDFARTINRMMHVETRAPMNLDSIRLK